MKKSNIKINQGFSEEETEGAANKPGGYSSLVSPRGLRFGGTKAAPWDEVMCDH